MTGPYSHAMPVSRRRKKNRKSPANKPRPPVVGGRAAWPGGPAIADVMQTFADLANERERLAGHRAAAAAAGADQVVADLIAYASANPDADLEGEMSARLGDQLRRWRDGPIMEAPDSDAFIGAVVPDAVTRVGEALVGTEPAAWQVPWQVLVAVASLVPTSSIPAVSEAVDELRGLPGGAVLPALPDGPTIAGPLRWTCDGYGSRFGVLAPIASPGRPKHWYLWDVDACGHTPMTVYAGYHDSAEQAVDGWLAGVGPVAAGGTAFADVDDPGLAVQLLGREYQYRGEAEPHLGEYFRSRRLADVAIGSLDPNPTALVDILDSATAVTEFTAWLQEHRPELAAADDLVELVTELAHSWCFGEPETLLGTCSPHRVAYAVLHLYNYYKDDFADELMTLLPDWTMWLAERNGTPSQLAERCRPYALGETHADVGADNSHPIMTARVIE
jgi:hypothetical protein